MCNKRTAIVDGTTVEIAPLETIDFASLVRKDPGEIAQLLKSSQTHGFFYVDLQNDATNQILTDMKDVLHLVERYFDQPMAVKMKDDRWPSQTHGYKPTGVFTGVAQDSRDGYETLKVGLEEMMQKSPKLPSIARDNLELFHRYLWLSDYITQTLLSCLSDALKLERNDRFEQSHRAGERTNTMLVILHYPPTADASKVGHNKHTDIGSLTLLFSEQWGLQVVTPETGKWTFVEPRPGHAVINVGDSLRFLSGKRLYSCLHRVVPSSGEHQTESRYSLAYTMRPESAAQFDDVQGKRILAQEWHDWKYVMFAEPHSKQRESQMLTGGMEEVLGASP